MQRCSRHFRLSWAPVRVISHRRNRTPFTQRLQGKRWDWIILLHATHTINASPTQTHTQIHFFMIIISPPHGVNENDEKLFLTDENQLRNWHHPVTVPLVVFDSCVWCEVCREWHLCIIKCFPQEELLILICYYPSVKTHLYVKIEEVNFSHF